MFVSKHIAVAESIESDKSTSALNALIDACTFGLFKSTSKVAIVYLHGTIGKVGGPRSSGMTLRGLNQTLEKAFKISKLDAVILSINSPGGSPVQSELITSRIRQLSQKHDIPVYSFVEDVAASGGYWLATAADEIYASKSSIVGSIGVISAGFGLQDAIKKIGVERRIFTSGNSKSVLDPFSPVKEEDLKILHSIQGEVHEAFIHQVKRARGGRLNQNDDVLFNGSFWSGQIALDYGLIDGIDDAYNFIQNKFGKNTEIEYVGSEESWLKKKLGITHDVSLNSGTATSIAEEVIESMSRVRM